MNPTNDESGLEKDAPVCILFEFSFANYVAIVTVSKTITMIQLLPIDTINE